MFILHPITLSNLTFNLIPALALVNQVCVHDFKVLTKKVMKIMFFYIFFF